MMRWTPGLRVRSRRNHARLGTVVGNVGSFLTVQWDDRLDCPKPYFDHWGGTGEHPARTWRFVYRSGIEPIEVA